jgi:hypothetical protein
MVRVVSIALLIFGSSGQPYFLGFFFLTGPEPSRVTSRIAKNLSTSAGRNAILLPVNRTKVNGIRFSRSILYKVLTCIPRCPATCFADNSFSTYLIALNAVSDALMAFVRSGDKYPTVVSISSWPRSSETVCKSE